MSKARDIASAIPAPSTVSSAELGFLDGVTSAIQTQIDTKAPSSTAVTLTDTQTLTNKTLTNPVIASVINNTLTSTTGDMIYASAANTPARLGIGSTDQILKVTGGVPVWATPSSGGKTWQQSATGSLTGSSITVSNLTGQDILVSWQDWSASVNSVQLNYRLNGNSGSIYRVQTSDATSTSARAFGAIEGNVISWAFVYIPAASSTIQIKTAISNLYPWAIKEPNAVTSIEFFPSSGSFDAGNYYVWELK